MKSMKNDIILGVPFIEQWAKKNGSFLTGHFDTHKLYTALQHIFSLPHKRVVGCEALMRVKNTDGQWISPAPLFEQCESPMESIHLDRLSRYLHLNNFLNIKDNINWLFLNVSPKTIINARFYGPFFKDLIESVNFPAHRIVIEVVEQPIEDNALLLETINFYKELGCLIAIDDFGAGHSNFDRIWTLKPDIVKLDRSFLIRASKQKSIRRLLPGIVSLLHQAGALVLLEGIETFEQALIAVEGDVDFVQGFYFGRPFTDLLSPASGFNTFDNLFGQYKTFSKKEDKKFHQKVNQCSLAFNDAVENLMNGVSFEKVSDKLLLEPLVVRCYQIEADGVQIGSTKISKTLKANKDKRYQPLDDAKSADWFRRHYLKRAVLHPGQLQISRPYLSITGAHMCVTLSMKFSGKDRDSILCVDLID